MTTRLQVTVKDFEHMQINKTIAPNTTQEDARQFAIEWQHWASDQNLSYGELAEWGAYFEMIGERFDLLEEFKENGII